MFFLALVSVLAASAAAQTVNDCPAGIARDQYLDVHNGACLEFVFSIKRDYPTAERECEKLGGTLVMIKNAVDQQYIFGKIKELGPNAGSVWIGLDDIVTEKTFVWQDGSPVGYENWAKTDGPNNYFTGRLEDCVAINPSTGEWEDYHCESGGLTSIVNDVNHVFICQYPIST